MFSMSNPFARRPRARLENALPFKHFVLRTQTLQLYASFLRTLQSAGLSKRPDLRAELRSGFRQHSSVRLDDFARRKALLSEGQQQLAAVRKQLGIAVVLPSGEGDAAGAGDVIAKDPVVQLPQDDPASLAAAAARPADDERYRMGSGWPWHSSDGDSALR